MVPAVIVRSAQRPAVISLSCSSSGLARPERLELPTY
jgi:hypothetical protein